MEIKINKYDHMGKGISFDLDKIVFVKRAIPSEIVDIDIESDKSKYKTGIIKRIIKESEFRIEPVCPYYDKCGGCDFLHTKNEIENNFKINKAKELLGLEIEFFDTKEYNYRNKVTLHVKDNKIGFYNEKSHEIIDINYCYLVNDNINDIINKLNNYIKNNKLLINEVIIRATDKSMLIIEGKIDDKFIKTFSFVDTIINNDKVVKGIGYIEEKILDYKFRISPKSFFQVNKLGLESIFNILKNSIKTRYKKALDLYSGTSVMGILISSFCDKVISIECNSSSTKDALINKDVNKIGNLEIINDKVENYIEKFNDIDLIIVDPPRSGLDKKTISYLKKIKSETFIYISCNMITLKRDLELLKDEYKLEKIKLVNMFPKTYHVECVVILNGKY